MNRLPQAKREQILALLVEGNSIRATARITDVAFNTVLALIPVIGAACENYQHKIFHNLVCRYIQIDEIWSFVAKRREHTTPEEREQGLGDVWTYVAIDTETKLVPSWMIGPRNYKTTYQFIGDLRSRVSNKPHLTSDGYKAYPRAIDQHFDRAVDYAMLIKIYENDKTDPDTLKLIDTPGINPVILTGNPDPKRISTSLIERQNLTMRQSMRRFTRKTNGHSKKIENHAAAIALHFMWYNFGRIHSILRVTPAMAAGISDHVWEFGEILALTNTVC